MYRSLSLILLILLIVFAAIQITLPSRDSTHQVFNDSKNVEFESGVRRLRDGTVEVASLVSMPGVTSDMFRWWFSDYLQTTEHYRMWHPEDHVWMGWEHKTLGKITGSHHLVHEYIGGDLMKLRIQFAWPQEILGYEPTDENTVASVLELANWSRVSILLRCAMLREIHLRVLSYAHVFGWE